MFVLIIRLREAILQNKSILQKKVSDQSNMAIFWGEKLWRNKGKKAGWKLLCGKKAKFLEENKIQVYLAYRLLAAQIGLNHLSLPCHTLTIMHFIFQLLYQVGTLVVALKYYCT